MTTTRTPTRSPHFETPASRLAELVHLLADVPLSQALDELPDDIEQPVGPQPDPLWVVAGALVRLRRSAHRRSAHQPSGELAISA